MAEGSEDAQQLEAALPPQTRIAWSKEDQAFRVVEVVRDGIGSRKDKPHVEAKGASIPGSLEAAVEDFVSLSEEIRSHESVEELVEMRREILDEILQPSALQLLPYFLSRWRLALSHVVSGHAQPDTAVVVLVCEELKQLAETEMLMGDIGQARAALGQCIRLTRHHDLDTKVSIASDAKRLLLLCIQFHEQLKLCVAGLGRQDAPFATQREILRVLAQLQTLAPHSIDVMALHVSVMMEMHRSREVVTRLSGFAFTQTNAQLTLLYVRALEYEGFYNDSISTATSFCEKHSEGGDEKLRTALEMHIMALQSVLKGKTTAEDALFRSRFQEAEAEFSQALRHTDRKSSRLRAVLLLGRANAQIGRERMLSARRDLEESVALDPSNQLTRMRLQTVHLALETQRIQRRLG